MTPHFTKGGVRSAAVALCAIAAIATAACATAAPANAAPATAAGRSQLTAVTAAGRSQLTAVTVAGRSQLTAVTVAATTGVPVVVNCGLQAQTRPSQFILACGDGGASLDRLSWAAWGSSSAFADGDFVFKDCVPYCAAGHSHSFPALVAIWGAEPWPGHAGQMYFTHLIVIFTGNHSFRAGGKLYQLPATVNYTLSADGGA